MELWPLDTLVDHARAQLTEFHARKPSEGRYGFLLFERAIVRREPRAWDKVIELYGPQVRSWLVHHPSFHDLRQEPADCAMRAFERMWKAIPAERFGQFTELSQLLQFLKLCINSEIMEQLREATRRAKWSALRKDGTDDGTWDGLLDSVQADESTLEDLAVAKTFWQRVAAELRTEQERIVVEYSYVLDLPPREIARLREDLFHSTAEVSRVKENVLRRLRRDFGQAGPTGAAA